VLRILCRRRCGIANHWDYGNLTMVIAPGEKGSEGAELASVGAPVDELMAKPARESFLVPAIKMNLPCESIVADTKL
jgi:hypothetical protein